MYQRRHSICALLLLSIIFILEIFHYCNSSHDVKLLQTFSFWPDAPKSSVLSQDTIAAYVKAIDEPENEELPRLHCPKPNLPRYQHLKPRSNSGSQTQFFFALNLRGCLPVLPRLLGSVVEAIRFLGPENCALSIVEGNSPDGTAEVLYALQPGLSQLLEGRMHLVVNSKINPLAGGRFQKLAKLRNMALEPILREPERYANAEVIFLNDVAICAEDILELVYQRNLQGADMTCAFDWILGSSGNSIFYDSYVARAINGDLFFDIPPGTDDFGMAHDLFWNEPLSRARFDAYEPFQVFSCWNGAVVFMAEPLAKGKVRFRVARIREGECLQAEPHLFCKDMWFRGHGKIAVVPSVNLEYSDEKAAVIKREKGYVSDLVKTATPSGKLIEWLPPPDKFKCMPDWNKQSWRPWNETCVSGS
jgi:alpha-1,3-mannosyltransferase